MRTTSSFVSIVRICIIIGKLRLFTDTFDFYSFVLRSRDINRVVVSFVPFLLDQCASILLTISNQNGLFCFRVRENSVKSRNLSAMRTPCQETDSIYCPLADDLVSIRSG